MLDLQYSHSTMFPVFIASTSNGSRAAPHLIQDHSSNFMSEGFGEIISGSAFSGTFGCSFKKHLLQSIGTIRPRLCAETIRFRIRGGISSPQDSQSLGSIGRPFRGGFRSGGSLLSGRGRLRFISIIVLTIQI